MSKIAYGYPVVDSTVASTSQAAVDPSVSASYLRSLGAPAGLASQYLKSSDDFPLRVWIVDNSGSMQTCDGKRVAHKSDGTPVSVTCSRWDELGDSLDYHCGLAVNLGAPTMFCVLNPPGGGVPQTMWCGTGSPASETETVRRLRESSPTGRTPLCAAIRTAIHTIVERAPALVAAGKRCVLVIASDGAASDGDVAVALKPLQDLPVWVVVRLCTDDDDVVNYWQAIDEQLELNLDVLDDNAGEAVEIKKFAPWLNYAQPLHRLREWGSADKLLDLLDEKKLSPAEVRKMIAFVLGGASLDLPDPQVRMVCRGDHWGG